MKNKILACAAVIAASIGAPAAAQEPAAAAVEPEVKADPAKDIALLDGVIKARSRDKASAEEVAKAYHRIAQLYVAKGDFKSAALTREKVVEWFETQGHPKDGGVIATLAAEARFRALELPVQAELDRKLVIDGKVGHDARKHAETWLEVVGGHAKLPALTTKETAHVTKEPARVVKTKPLVDQLTGLRAYAALAWTRAGHLQAGRLLMAISLQLAAWAALETADKQAELVEASRQLRDQAAEVWEKSWKESDVQGQRDNWAVQIRKELSSIKPAEYPEIDKASDQENMSPQQQEASRLAALAQRSDNLQLKVLYLRKAVNLDPANAHMKELLKHAEAEQAVKQQQKP